MKYKKWIISGSILLAIVCVFFIWGTATHTKTDFYNDFKQALDDNDAEEMQQLLATSDSALKIDKAGSQAFIDYLTNNPADKDQFLKILKEETTGDKSSYSADFPYEFVKDGREILFFPNYALSVKPLYFTVITDADKAAISVNKKEVPYIKNADKYGPLMPGAYDVDVTLSCAVDTPIIHMKNKQLIKSNQNLDLQVGDVLSEDKSFQSSFAKNMDQSMEEFAKYWGGGLDTTQLVTATDNYQEAAKEEKEMLLPYLSKTDITYEELQLNNDSIKIKKKLDNWEATFEANVVMHGNVAIAEEDIPPLALKLEGVRKFTFAYDTKQDKWLLDTATESFSDPSDWENIQKIKHENPQKYEWTSGKDQAI